MLAEWTQMLESHVVFELMESHVVFELMEDI